MEQTFGQPKSQACVVCCMSHVMQMLSVMWSLPCACTCGNALLCQKYTCAQTKRACVWCMQVYMCANQWQDVKYTRVPSVCMKNNKGSFEEHDKKRFTQYLEDVQAGKKSIASGALKPHELVEEAMQHTRSGMHACTCKALEL